MKQFYHHVLPDICNNVLIRLERVKTGKCRERVLLALHTPPCSKEKTLNKSSEMILDNYQEKFNDFQCENGSFGNQP